MSWACLSNKTVIARKRHRCLLCGLDIGIGIPYILRAGAEDGTIHQFRMHTQCEEVTKNWTIEDWEYRDSCEFRRINLAPEQLAEIMLQQGGYYDVNNG